MAEDTYEDFDKYRGKILDVDEDVNMDLKINPDYYIHYALMSCQNALKNTDIRLLVIQYRHSVEHLEKLVKAAGMLPNDYQQLIKLDERKEESDETRMMKLSQKKFEVIVEQIFSRKTITQAMKV